MVKSKSYTGKLKKIKLIDLTNSVNYLIRQFAVIVIRSDKLPLMKTENKRKFLSLNYNYIIVFLILIYLMAFISGQVPGLSNIQGYIMHKDGTTQAQSSTKVRIVSNSSGNIINLLTSGPPGHSGFYSTNINHTEGENFTITALNSTAYGINITTLINSPSTLRLNISMNNTRPAETDLNITSPSNETSVVKYANFNISFNVSAIGGQNSLNCNVTINISNENIINISTIENKTKQLGNINLGTSLAGYFNMQANNQGSSYIALTSACSSDGLNFENLQSESITIDVSNQPPQLHTIQGYIFNLNNVTQVPTGINVTINATATGSSISILTSGPPGHTGFYSTTIYASDGEVIIIRANNGTYHGIKNTTLLISPSITRLNLSLDRENLEPPIVDDVVVDDEFLSPTDEIDLTVAGTKLISCIGNVSDPNNYTDIKNVTAILYDMNNASLTSQDDKNNHYTNNSCILNNCSGESCGFECSFDVWYFANANTDLGWICYVTGTDNSNTSGFGSDAVSINTLLGVEFPDTIDFGSVGNNKVSNESSNNVTNRGNVMIDISLDGYGGTDGDGNAMNCSNGRNISIGYEKYNLTASNPGDLTLAQFASLYKNLTDNAVNETEFNLDFRKNDTSDFIDDFKLAYWRIFVPGGIAVNTSCSGKINIGAMIDT